MKEKDAIIIFTANTARYLLRHGETMIDLKPDKHNKDRSVFVFAMSDSIKTKIKQHAEEEKANETKNIRCYHN